MANRSPLAQRHQRAQLTQMRTTGKVYVPGLGLVHEKVKSAPDERRRRIKRLEEARREDE